MTESLENRTIAKEYYKKTERSIRNYRAFSGTIASIISVALAGLVYVTYINQKLHADNCQYPSGFETSKINPPTF